MTSRVFPPKGPDGPPSTQFSATIVAMPELGGAPPHGQGASGSPDSISPDTLATDGSFGDGPSPDVVTDIGGLPSEVPDPADAPTISHIGRYALKRQLGAGGLGSVFEAWDPLLSRAVAVKTLQLDVDPSARTSLDGLFLNEARAAAGLNHRYIVTIFDAGLSPHGVYIAMERLYGRDLQRALSEGWRPSVEQVVQLVRRVTEALAYAHARGVVHCDIKPGNIFLQRREKPKVLDFGIARIIHGAALPALEGAVAGSPRYRAPEQLEGGAVDARTDLYSLGVVMYELLTGRRAFEGDSLAEINQAVLQGSVKPAHEVDSRVPREVSDIVARMMARQAADRYTCASELSVDLRSWMQAQLESAPGAPGGTARSRSRAPTEPPAKGGNGLMIGALVLAAVAALVAGGLTLHGRTRAPDLRLDAPVLTAPAQQPSATPSTAVTLPLPAAVISASSPTNSAPAAPTSTSAADSAVAAVPSAAAANPTRGAAPERSTPPPAARQKGAEAGTRTKGTNAAEAQARDNLRDAEATTGSGTLQLAVSPWGQVEIDGQPAGTTPPLTRLNLPAGLHTVTLRNADFPPHTVQIQVGVDKPVTLRHRFGS